jgi:hypothetical protein
MESPHHIFILSRDYIFSELMATMFRQFLKNAPLITILHSFNSIREDTNLEKGDLILLDDLVEGARGSAILEYLRISRQLICPIAYFCDDVPELKENAIRRGSNFCYTKPFKPGMIVLDLLQKRL